MCGAPDECDHIRRRVREVLSRPSYRPAVCGRDGRRTLDRGNELRIGAALPVGVVVELTGRRVVDQTIVRIVSGARTRRGEKAAIARRELAGAAERVERRAIEAQHVPGGGEVRQDRKSTRLN